MLIFGHYGWVVGVKILKKDAKVLEIDKKVVYLQSKDESVPHMLGLFIQ